ncbi:hypothetical protein AZ09_04515 [Acetobacter aceti 1023]|nr:hypothetical protein AZ09_04515 [Acetobacter aceti 1023]
MSILLRQFKQSFKYTGRLSVSDYRVWSLWLLVIFALTYIAHLYAVSVLNNNAASSINAVTAVYVFYTALLFVYVFLLFAIVSALVRRNHDLGRSGWFSVLWFVPYIGVMYWIYLVYAKGTQGPNAYGLPA